MTMTPNSSLSPYCSPAEFTTFCDWRTPAQLLSDTDVPLANAAAVQASAVLATLLLAASGEVEAASGVGGRYLPADLTALAATATASAAKLAELVAYLAEEKCYRRRRSNGLNPPEEHVRHAQEWLQALAEGHLIFGFTETMSAGRMQEYVENAADVEKRNLPSVIAGRMFGRRADRMIPGRWGD